MNRPSFIDPIQAINEFQWWCCKIKAQNKKKKKPLDKAPKKLINHLQNTVPLNVSSNCNPQHIQGAQSL